MKVKFLTILLFIVLPIYTFSAETIYYTTNGATPTATTGFSIFQRDQVIPKYLTLTDGTGSLEYINPGATPDYPATFGVKLCYSSPFSLYSASPAERLEVWQDSLGTATVADVLSVCPQFTR